MQSMFVDVNHVELPKPQADGEAPFAFLDRQKWEHQKTGLLLKVVRGGKFQGRKPNGTWWCSIKPAEIIQGVGRPEKREERDLFAGSPVELVLKAAVETCAGCGCDTDLHSSRAPSAEEEKERGKKDKPRCDGQRLVRGALAPCACAKTPAEIRAAQSNRKWLAERLSGAMQQKEIAGWREVDEENVFEGMRGGETAKKSRGER